MKDKGWIKDKWRMDIKYEWKIDKGWIKEERRIDEGWIKEKWRIHQECILLLGKYIMWGNATVQIPVNSNIRKLNKIKF